MRAVAIDDDANMLDLLAITIEDRGMDLELVGTATNYADGVALIKEKEPELLFLDIELDQGMTGFDVLRSLDHTKYAVVFISGKKHYGDLVVRFSALAYIYKPMNPALLAEAVTLARLRLKELEYQEQVKAMLEATKEKKMPTRMLLSNSDGRHVVAFADILYVRGQKEVISVHRAERKPIVKGTSLKAFAEDLKLYPEFMRVNRNYIINLYHLETEAHGPTLVMRDGTEIEISHTVAKEVRERLLGL